MLFLDYQITLVRLIVKKFMGALDPCSFHLESMTALVHSEVGTHMWINNPP